MDGQINGLQEFEKFRLDTRKKILWCENEVVNLPPKAVELLCVLLENKNQVLTKESLLDKIWHDSFVEDSNLTHHIYALRKTFKEFGCQTDLIQTVPRRGYRFVANVEEVFEREEVVIERHTFTKTMIEEVTDEKDFSRQDENPESLPEKTLPFVETVSRGDKSGNKYSRLLTLAGICAALFLASGFAVWHWNQANAKMNLTDVKSVAVLPLKSFDKSADDENLPLRITDALITKLGNLESVAVRPTSSVQSFDKNEIGALEAGRKLNVDAILDGRVQREGERVRVTLQLISVKNGEQLWSEQFDGQAGQSLNLQDAIASKLLATINFSLTPEQTASFAKRPTESAAAFENYLKANYFRQKRTADGLRTAISFYEKAIADDANFAQAYAGLADSQYLLVDYSYDTATENVARAKENLLKAIALEPNLAAAYVTLGLIETSYEWNWKRAEHSLSKAIAIAPNSPDAHHRYAMLMLKLRRFAEAETAMRRARDLDPLSLGINMNLGTTLYYAKRFDEAIEQFNKTIELDQNFNAPRWFLARCQWAKGEKDESLKQYVRAIQADGDIQLAEQIERQANSLEPEKIVENWAENWSGRINRKEINEHDLAVLSAQQGKSEAALQWLEKSVEARHPWAASINAEPEFDFLREEPRFQAILRRMNFN